MNWEYKIVSTPTGMVDLEVELAALGSLGWEAVGVTSSDKTIGLNEIVVLLKREAPGYPPHDNTAAVWAKDPSGRFEQRFWDGLRWTDHVSSGGKPDRDYPNVRA